MKTGQVITGSFLIMLAAMFWGVSGGIGGILMGDGWGPFVVSFYRGAVGLMCVLCWLVFFPQNNGLTKGKLWFWSIIAGLGVAGNFSFYFLSISYSSVAVAATLMYCAPVFVYLVSFTLKLEKPSALKWAAIAVVMVGIVLLTQIHSTSAGTISVIGLGAGVLSGLFYAVFIFAFKYASPHGSPQAILTIAFAVLCLILIGPGDSEQLVAVTHSSAWYYFVGLGVFGAGLSFILYIIGLKQTAPAVASIVAMVEPVTAALFGVIILNQLLMGSQVLGMALILLTVTAMSIFSKQNKL